MSTDFEQDKTQTLAWLIANTPVEDLAKAEWCVALWHTSGLWEASRKDAAHMLLDGTLTMRCAWASLFECVFEGEGDPEDVKNEIWGYF